MRVEECLPCPRCGHTQVVQRGRGAYLCFHCRYGWSIGPEADRCEQSTSELLSRFPPKLRARLIAYRAAIQDGLFTDCPRQLPS